MKERLRDIKGKIFVVKRSLSCKHGPGLFDSSIGGHINARESPSYAIIREAKEELGINIPRVKESLNHIIKDGTSNHLVFVYIIKHNGPFKLCVKEFSSGEWMNIQDVNKLREDKATPDFIKTIKKLKNSNFLSKF